MASEPTESFWEREMAEIVEPEIGIDDFPENPVEGVLYGFQHTLVDTTPFIVPLIVAGAAGWSGATVAYVIQATLVFSMITTVAQTMYGNRLPLVQSASLADAGVMATVAGAISVPAMWMGAFIGGIFEAVVGASRVLKYLRTVFTPVVSGAVIIVIGLSLAQVGMGWIANSGPGNTIPTAGGRFAFAGLTIALVIVLKFLGKLRFGGVLSRGALLISLLLVGLVVPAITDAAGLTSNVLNLQPVFDAAWIGIPTPGRLGLPGLDWPIVGAAVLAISIGYIGSIAESIGDYAATCAVSATTLDEKKINRGITVEGLGSAAATLFGGLPMTSYSQNVGVIATTRVASRKVVAIGGIFLGIYGLIPKIGRLITVIPLAVLGGVFLIITGMIAVSGIRMVAHAENKDANFLTAALTIAVALTLPSLASGSDWVGALPNGLEVFVTNGIVLAVVFGIVLSLLMGRIFEPYVSGRMSSASESEASD
ncbi:MAG: solute carrier family 23 protein [Halobacteria archaeon]|nr:solute carrier family 23 protein [Halobacteria archaeon]